MKKLELSEPMSHLLILSSVFLAFLPFLLGDQLVFLANSLMNEGLIMMAQINDYFWTLLS